MDQGLTGRKNAERDWQGWRKRCPIEVGQDEEDWRGEGGEVTGRGRGGDGEVTGRKQKGQAEDGLPFWKNYALKRDGITD